MLLVILLEGASKEVVWCVTPSSMTSLVLFNIYCSCREQIRWVRHKRHLTM